MWDQKMHCLFSFWRYRHMPTRSARGSFILKVAYSFCIKLSAFIWIIFGTVEGVFLLQTRDYYIPRPFRAAQLLQEPLLLFLDGVGLLPHCIGRLLHRRQFSSYVSQSARGCPGAPTVMPYPSGAATGPSGAATGAPERTFRRFYTQRENLAIGTGVDREDIWRCYW